MKGTTTVDKIAKKRYLGNLPLISKLMFWACLLILAVGMVALFFVHDDEGLSRVAFQLLETLVMIVALFVPSLLDRKFSVQLPPYMEVMFVVFCFCSLILGDVSDFYGRFHWWDTMLHALSGLMLGILAYAILLQIKQAWRLSPFFVALWVTCFSLAIGALWEIIEFTIDGLFGLNSQEFLLSSGTFDTESVPRVGRDALMDTMVDLVLDFVGALIIGILSYFDSRKRLRSKEHATTMTPV